MNARNIRSATRTRARPCSGRSRGRAPATGITWAHGRNRDAARAVSDRARLHVPRFAPRMRGRATELQADGYAIGGLSVGEPRPLSLEMAEATGPFCRATGRAMPWGRDAGGTGGVRSAGHRHDGLRPALPQRPQRILFTSRGVSSSKTQNTVTTAARRPNCLYTCTRYSRAYLRHLYQAGEILYSSLATRHNFRRYLDIMRGIRHAIISNSISRLLECAARAQASDGESRCRSHMN